MFLSRFTSRIRQLEAERAKENRRDIARSISQGQITKRDLIRWGLLSSTGVIAMKNGLSPFARSAYASVPTGSPRSPIPGGLKFKQKLPRAYQPDRFPLQQIQVANPISNTTENAYAFRDPNNGGPTNLLAARRSSYHSLYNHYAGSPQAFPYTNPVTALGPIEGRPGVHPGTGEDYFAHQRWDEFAPKVGYVMSIGQAERGVRIHPALAEQNANTMWSCGPRYGHTYEHSSPANGIGNPYRYEGPGYYGCRTGYATPPLILARYGEPIIARMHNDLPVERINNGGFGRNEISTHNHNAHNAAESDGANNAFHFPGTFYDYHWSTALARHDMNTNATLRAKMDTGFRPGDWRASTINDSGRPVKVQGDFREIQSSLWFHDHRFFFTAENVHKGMYGLINMYSGPDNGNESLGHYGALRLPSGTTKAWGNLDYDINLCVTNPAYDQQQQLTFDIFDTDGYLGDVLAVNGAYYPTLDVDARRYRFRILNASMSRFLQIALVDQDNNPLPFHVIANDGNLLQKPVLITSGILDQQGTGERFDIVVDFKRLKDAGVQKAFLVNLLYHIDGRGPAGRLTIGQAIQGVSIDPAVGQFLEFDLKSEPSVADQSADLFDTTWGASGAKFLTRRIPVSTAPVRERAFTFGRNSEGPGARDPITGQCTPDCGEAEAFPWSIKVNGQSWHSFNATRISALVPAAGDVEHWTFVNQSGGWDHPIHLHFEEGLTLDRGGAPMAATERLARKDVWRLRPGGTVKIQVRFSEFGGSYVQHCHNTTHEDFSMLMRVQVVMDPSTGALHSRITPTPLPSPNGVTWADSDVLPEAHPDFVPPTVPGE